LISRRVSLTNIMQACPLFSLGGSPPLFKPFSTSRIRQLSLMNRPPTYDVHLHNSSMFAICEQVEISLVADVFGRLGKDLRDDFLQRWVLDADILQRVVREHGREDLRDLLTIDAELHPRFGDFYDFAVAA
jgi:hypothetical protein